MSESEYVDRTPLDDPAWVIALVEERDALRARVRELEGALGDVLAAAQLLEWAEEEMLPQRYWEAMATARALLPAPAPGRDTAGPGTTAGSGTTTGGTDAA